MAPVLDKLLPVIALSAWGMIPDDLDYEFSPLRKADPKENAELAKSMAESVVNVYNASLISQQIALKELRQQSEITGMWSNITDEDIARADTEFDMGVELPGMEGFMAMDADWKEEDHPRRKDGKFGSGGGSGEKKKKQTLSSFEELAKLLNIEQEAKISEEDYQKPVGKVKKKDGQITLDEKERERYNKSIVGMKTSEGQVITGIWDHVFDRAAQRDVSPGEIKECLINDGNVYPGNKDDPRTVYQKGDLKVIVSDGTIELVSVMWRE